MHQERNRVLQFVQTEVCDAGHIEDGLEVSLHALPGPTGAPEFGGKIRSHKRRFHTASGREAVFPCYVCVARRCPIEGWCEAGIQMRIQPEVTKDEGPNAAAGFRRFGGCFARGSHDTSPPEHRWLASARSGEIATHQQRTCGCRTTPELSTAGSTRLQDIRLC